MALANDLRILLATRGAFGHVSLQQVKSGAEENLVFIFIREYYD